MLIHYWCPYLTNIATISSVKRSAIYLKKFDKKNEFNIEIINCYGEWSKFKNLNQKIIIKKPLTFLNLFNFLPKKNFLSKISLIIIFILSFFPLLIKLNKEKPKYIIIHLLTSLPLILSPFLNKKTKIILRISGLPKLNFFRKILWKLFSSKIFLVTTPTEITKEDLIKQNIFDTKKIHILRDPVIDVNEINKLKSENINNPLLKDKNFYLAIGRFTNQKNFIFLVKEFSSIVNKLKTNKLCIIGDGEQKNLLQKFINKKNMQENIFLISYQSNPFKYIQNCKALISPSLYEDPGFVLIETLFLNKLIISSNSRNGPKEMSFKKDMGFFFETNNSQDFQKKLLESEINDNYVKIINGKKFSKQFSVFNHCKKLKELIL